MDRGRNGELTVSFRAEDEHEEAFFVAEEIERLRQSEEGYRYSDVAVFYRTNAQSRVIEDVLMRVGSPTRSSAACGSTSGKRSRTSWATCACWSTRRT